MYMYESSGRISWILSRVLQAGLLWSCVRCIYCLRFERTSRVEDLSRSFVGNFVKKYRELLESETVVRLNGPWQIIVYFFMKFIIIFK